MGNIIEYSLKKKKTNIPSIKISTPGDVIDYIKQFYGDDLEVYESFFMLALNRSNKTLGFVKISQGGIDQCIVDTELVALYAIKSLSRGVIVFHNHPSGSLIVSNADKNITRDIKYALKLFNITLFDSIILTANGYHSMADNKEID